MSNSIQNLVKIPQNDQELNLLTNAMNKAYSKYFNFETGVKKSNNLRDCYCESIGFTNGAYRQLQAYWSASTAYDFTDLVDNSFAMLSDIDGGYSSVFAQPIATQLIDYLCEYFPVNDDGFLDEEKLYSDKLGLNGKMSENEGIDWESYGWGMLISDDEHQVVVSKEKENGKWFPLYYGNIIIGFAFYQEFAKIMNGLLISAKHDGAINLGLETYNHDWTKYISEVDEDKCVNPGKYLSLRMSSMESSLYIPFDSVLIEDDQLILTHGTEDIILSYNKKDNMITFADMNFDFASFYYIGKEQKTIKLTKGQYDDNNCMSFPEKKDIKIEFAEWFPQDRIEYRLENSDDIDDINYVSQVNYLIS
jgi:hypothetical protein